MVGSASTVPQKSSRFTDSGILAQHHKCTIIQPRQEHNPSPSTPHFAVPPQEGYIKRQGLTLTPFFQSFRDGDIGAAG